MSQNDRALFLRSLHRKGNPLVLCNVYDGRTADIVLSHKGSNGEYSAKALATSSFAVAAVHGKPDEELEPEMLAMAAKDIVGVINRHVSARNNSNPIPLSIDMRDGWGDRLEETITSLIEAGVVGCNLEDEDNETGQCMPLPQAVDRIKRVMAKAAELGVPDFVINARTDVLGHGGTIEEAISRGKAFMEAGAFCIFIWGGSHGRGVSKEGGQMCVNAFDGLWNARLKTGPGYLTVKELTDMGVRRISLGKELGDIAMEAYRAAVEKVLA